jgi:AcrR family transcriptional regulator
MARAGRILTTGARLLDIAVDHVRKHGMERTTIVSIAREAGVSHAAVYRYYADKDELIDAITAEWLTALETTLNGIADAPDPAEDKIERMVLALARALRDRLDTEANLYALYLDAIDTRRPIVRKHRRRLNMLFERVIDEGMSTSAFHEQPMEPVRQFLYDALHRFTDAHAVKADKDTPRHALDARLERVLSVVLRAMATRAV